MRAGDRDTDRQRRKTEKQRETHRDTETERHTQTDRDTMRRETLRETRRKIEILPEVDSVVDQWTGLLSLLINSRKVQLLPALGS